MGETETKTPQLQASKEPVKHCPFCGLGPFEGTMCNEEIECSEDIGGCGKKFKVFRK